MRKCFCSGKSGSARFTDSGFVLIQIAILLTVASLLVVAVLPSLQTAPAYKSISVTKMNTILLALRQYELANGKLPCPADPTLFMGSSNYGVAAANGGTGSNCTGSTPAAAYADTTNNIAIGMVPVRTLGLSNDYALDGFGRDITYAVDTNATGCWTTNSLKGTITVLDNGNSHNTVAVLISHGANGYGAWLPLNASSGTAQRINSGSKDNSEADNAQVAQGGGLTSNTTFASFVAKGATSTFDDVVVYSGPSWNLATLPRAASSGNVSLTYPANGSYYTGSSLTFTLTYSKAVTVTGTPRLDITAVSGGNSSIGGGTAYANYASGSGTNTLTFTYQVTSSDLVTNGITIASPIDLNGGTISVDSTCFSQFTLSNVFVPVAWWHFF